MENRLQPSLLLIDDNPEELSPLITRLGTAGFRISQAHSAQQGYQRALALQPDLIILDLYMPKMDGFAICRLLQKVPDYPFPPVIFLSSSTSIEDRLKGFELGAVDFVTKPYSPEEVIARIQTHLRLSMKTEKLDATKPRATPIDEDEIIFDTAVQLIMGRLADPLSLEEIARSSGTHEKRLLQIFRKQLGMTVFAFIRDARLRKGRELLSHEMISIENIAAAVGFSSAANFSTAFKAHEGITPREYRNRLHRRTQQTAG